MCTVTYLPLQNNNFILTSNRDETPLRNTIPPKKYLENNAELTYPKDKLAGGTWIGTSNKNRMVCLLNGAFKKHIKKSNYRMSRGIVVKNILSADNAVTYINDFNFDDIEPFTIVLVDWNQQLETYEFVWDGQIKHFTKLAQEPRIWSSSPLYTDEMKQLRNNWFADWLKENKEFTQENILEFHTNETFGNAEVSPKMKRPFIETVSITSIEKRGKNIFMKYSDISKNENFEIVLNS
jgi:uncharacterized protein with NRDE domain